MRTLPLILALATLAGCGLQESQDMQLAVLKQVKHEWVAYHQIVRQQIRSDKLAWLDLTFQVDLQAAADADDKVPMEKVKELIAKRAALAATVDQNLLLLDADVAERIALIDRGIELGNVTRQTLDAWAQVELILREEAANPTLLPMLLGTQE